MVDWLVIQFHTQLGFSIVLLLVVIPAVLTGVGYSTYFERKVSAWLQDRHGPNRAGPLGLLQPVADGVKFLLKEDFMPAGADRPLYILAPMLSMGIAMLGLAVIPWGGSYQPAGLAEPLQVQVAGLDIGLLYLLAVGALGVYGVVLAGWSSNNKYAFYGGLRAAAQMVSYEIPLGLSILVIVLASGQLRLENIVEQQTALWWGFLPQWNIFLHPVSFIIMFTCVLAETNRAPFDLAECEQELVGGFHTEYNAMKWAMFFLGEYTHMIVGSAFMVCLFFGGWHVPGLAAEQTTLWGVLLQLAVMGAKISIFIFVFMWIRWTLPRFRFDQLMRLCWKGLLPVSLALALVVVVELFFNVPRSYWSLIGEVGVVAVALVAVSLFRIPVTGRQWYLPDLDNRTPLRGGSV
ncbi:MAG: NADH-quinone oxidoreductase subunit H [Phycisphaerae bacterium]|nr:NADH-quinone oxidoreductase subunit H [Phycisphaerae bacterium]